MKPWFQLPLTALGLAFLGLLAPSALHATNLVSNGNFSGTASWSTTQTNGDDPWTWGLGYASAGCVGANCITGTVGQISDLNQDLTTNVGDSYTLSFEFYPNDGTPNELKVLFGSTVADALVNTANTGSYVTYTVSGLIASSTSTELRFLGRQDPGFDRLTDVSVVDGGGPVGPAVPEPNGLYLLGTGLAALGGLARRKVLA